MLRSVEALCVLKHYCGCCPERPCIAALRLFRGARRRELRTHLLRTWLARQWTDDALRRALRAA